MKTEKTYIHRRVCLCRQCGGTGSVTVYAEKDVRGNIPSRKCVRNVRAADGSG
jgi:hypothetical protein